MSRFWSQNEASKWDDFWSIFDRFWDKFLIDFHKFWSIFARFLIDFATPLVRNRCFWFSKGIDFGSILGRFLDRFWMAESWSEQPLSRKTAFFGFPMISICWSIFGLTWIDLWSIYQQIDTIGKPKKAIFLDRGCSAQDSAIQNPFKNWPKIAPTSVPLENKKQRFCTRGGRKINQKSTKSNFDPPPIQNRSKIGREICLKSYGMAVIDFCLVF